jgi:hypothetical protein
MRVVSACSSVDFIRVFVGDGVVRAPACWRDANGWICDHRRADEVSPDTQALAAMSKRIGLSRRAPTTRAARAASVYASNDDAPRFRAGLFFHCVVAPPR